MMIWSRACWTRLFFRVVVREREREKKAVFARATKTRKTTKGIIGFIIIPGKEGDLSKRSKDLQKRTSHLIKLLLLLVVVVFFRPQRPREKIVVAVLRAKCRSMMIITEGFRRRTTTTTHDDDANEWRHRRHYYVEGSPPANFSFLGFYKTLNFIEP